MPTLRELQRRFAAALFTEVYEPCSGDIRAAAGDSHARLGIYRNQLHGAFARTLTLEYPVIERLVGGQYFQRLAREFQAAHPSRSGNLHHIGAPFAAFLKQHFGAGRYDYLPDVAALEWALQECAVAADVPPLDLQALQSVAPADYAELHFELHPACRLVGSRYPTLDIWRANQTGAAATESIDLASGATYLLAQRSAHGIVFHALTAAEFVFVQKLFQDFSLGAALEAAQKSDPGFDPGAALRRCVALHALTGARLQQSARNGIC
jgi:hypothetical protein